jgi:hypothetical protein
LRPELGERTHDRFGVSNLLRQLAGMGPGRVKTKKELTVKWVKPGVCSIKADLSD